MIGQEIVSTLETGMTNRMAVARKVNRQPTANAMMIQTSAHYQLLVTKNSNVNLNFA